VHSRERDVVGDLAEQLAVAPRNQHAGISLRLLRKHGGSKKGGTRSGEMEWSEEDRDDTNVLKARVSLLLKSISNSPK
jgi:hypothetical protein